MSTCISTVLLKLSSTNTSNTREADTLISLQANRAYVSQRQPQPQQSTTFMNPSIGRTHGGHHPEERHHWGHHTRDNSEGTYETIDTPEITGESYVTVDNTGSSYVSVDAPGSARRVNANSLRDANASINNRTGARVSIVDDATGESYVSIADRSRENDYEEIPAQHRNTAFCRIL